MEKYQNIISKREEKTKNQTKELRGLISKNSKLNKLSTQEAQRNT